MDSEIVAKEQSVHFPRFLFIILFYDCLPLCSENVPFYCHVHIWQWCVILPPHLWGSWNCVFSKQFWAESPDLTVLSEIECITLSLQYIYCFQLFLPLLLKSAAVETFIQAASEDLFLYKTVNRTYCSYSLLPAFCVLSRMSCVVTHVDELVFYCMETVALGCWTNFHIWVLWSWQCCFYCERRRNCSSTGSLKSFINIL